MSAVEFDQLIVIAAISAEVSRLSHCVRFGHKL